METSDIDTKWETKDKVSRSGRKELGFNIPDTYIGQLQAIDGRLWESESLKGFNMNNLQGQPRSTPKGFNFKSPTDATTIA